MDTFVPTFSFVAGESASGSEATSFTGTAEAFVLLRTSLIVWCHPPNLVPEYGNILTKPDRIGHLWWQRVKSGENHIMERHRFEPLILYMDKNLEPSLYSSRGYPRYLSSFRYLSICLGPTCPLCQALAQKRP